MDIQDGVHARACTGGSIALAQSDLHKVSGKLPNGDEFTAEVRVTQPHALVMLKLLALVDRYSNIRGPKEARHDREEAQTHAADIVAILTVVSDIARFNSLFVTQFLPEPQLGLSALRVLGAFFREVTAPDLIVYTEYLAANMPRDRATSEVLRRETELAQRIVAQILPPPEFFGLAAAVDDSTEPERGAPFVEQYLSTLENTRIPVTDALALQSVPSGAFGGAYKPGATFVMSASEPLQRISAAQRGQTRVFAADQSQPIRTRLSFRQTRPRPRRRFRGSHPADRANTARATNPTPSITHG